MNKRLTVSIPDYLYRSVTTTFKRGEVSKFAARALQSGIFEENIKRTVDPVEDFIRFARTLPKVNMPYKKLKKIMRKGLM